MERDGEEGGEVSDKVVWEDLSVRGSNLSLDFDH